MEDLGPPLTTSAARATTEAQPGEDNARDPVVPVVPAADAEVPKGMELEEDVPVPAVKEAET